MQISCFPTSQRCSSGLRSGYDGCHLNTVKSLSCSRIRFEMMCHGVLSCWKEKMGTLWSQRAGNGQLKYSGRLLCLSDSHLVEKNPPHHYTTSMNWMSSCCLHQIQSLPSKYHSLFKVYPQFLVLSKNPPPSVVFCCCSTSCVQLVHFCIPWL